MSEENTNAPVENTEAPVENTEVSEENQDAQPHATSETVEAEAKDETGVAEQVKEAARKLKLKIDGIEQEYDEDTVVKMAQQSAAAQKRFNEAAKMRKESARFIEMLKENPLEVLTHPDIGVDVKEFAEQYLLKEIQKQEMSPEALKAAELEEKVQAMEREKAEAAQKEQEMKQLKLQEHYTQEYEKSIQSALESTEIPKTVQSVQRMAQYMASALEHDVEITAKQAAEMVRKDYERDVASLVKNSEAEVILKLLGDDVANKIRKYDLSKLEQGLQKATEKQEEIYSGEEGLNYNRPVSEPSQKMSVLEWREHMEKLRNS